MKVSVVIPNWNGRDKLGKNLPGVLSVSGIDEIIVVDDKSTDDSVLYIKSNFPKIKLIQKEKNQGFSSTVNLGVKNAIGDLIFLLNSDALPESDCLKYVLPHFEDKRVFSVGLSSGGGWNWAVFKNGFFWHGQRDLKEEAHQTMWVSGGSGVFRKKVWDELGGLDVLFNPFYEEDLDIGYRATKRGYINIFEPKSRVWHGKEKGVIAENFSEIAIAKIAQRNQLIFIWKNITSKKLISSHKRALLKKLINRPKYVLVVISALMSLDKILESRKREERDEVISDEEILSKF